MVRYFRHGVKVNSVNFVPHVMKTSKIVVTSYEEKVISGILTNPYFGEARTFKGAIQLLFLIEQLQNELEYPEETTQTRTFHKVKCLKPEIYEPPPEWEETALATFRISIYFRQNTTWQGSIFWEEQESAANFRSVFELIKLIDSVFASQTATK